MPERIKLDLVTPERLVLSEEFESVNAVSVIGEFGVLPGHAPMLALLRPGIVTAVKEGKKAVFAVKSGVAEVEPGRVVIMTETAAAAPDIDVEETRRELAETEQKSKACMDSIESVEFKRLPLVGPVLDRLRDIW
jgi:F-type H+-transporting ATPase subunit epsilon